MLAEHSNVAQWMQRIEMIDEVQESEQRFKVQAQKLLDQGLSST